MKTQLLLISLSVVIFLGGCGSEQNYPGWKTSQELGEIWEKAKHEEIKKIIFCETDTKDVEQWYIAYEVQPEALENTIALIDDSLIKCKNDEKRQLGNFKWMKIITEKNKYLVPSGWDSRKIYGVDWTSFDLREYLLQNGFKNPQ